MCGKVYNEQVRDLMSPGGPLALRVDSAGYAVVAGLTVHKVSTAVSLNSFTNHSIFKMYGAEYW